MQSPVQSHENRAFGDKAAPLVGAIESRLQAFPDIKDLKPLIDRISESKIVMLGESTHGTQEFYEWRRLISEWLIVKHGFNFIAVEGDWPPCWELNRFTKGAIENDIYAILKCFNRWPTWMWANSEIVRFALWLRSHNETVPPEAKVGFFGLDVYSIFESIDRVVNRLNKTHPFLARRVRERYACFDQFAQNEKSYALSLAQIPWGCQTEVLHNLVDILKLRVDNLDSEMLLDVQQNARVVANAENYYRTMVHPSVGEEDSWNVRDKHMMETLNVLLEQAGGKAKAIVWAHNTHIGDYRATDMLKSGQVNLGGLAREEWGHKKVALVGFDTYEGEVIASHAWDGPIERIAVPAASPSSHEYALHRAAQSKNLNRYFILLDDTESKTGVLSEKRGQRAIGVVYHPRYERWGNYMPTSLSHRYDALVFFDKTNALTPLIQEFDRKEIPETWQSGT